MRVAPCASPPGVLEVYDRMTKPIGEFEKTRVLNRLTSKFDYVLARMTELPPREQQGLALFEGKAQCSACHISQPATAPDGSVLPPLFTDFTYRQPRSAAQYEHPGPT
jgi:cytochrome c peroxidase